MRAEVGVLPAPSHDDEVHAAGPFDDDLRDDARLERGLDREVGLLRAAGEILQKLPPRSRRVRVTPSWRTGSGMSPHMEPIVCSTGPSIRRTSTTWSATRVESNDRGELDRVAGGGGSRLRAVGGNQDAVEQAPSFAEATAGSKRESRSRPGPRNRRSAAPAVALTRPVGAPSLPDPHSRTPFGRASSRAPSEVGQNGSDARRATRGFRGVLKGTPQEDTRSATPQMSRFHRPT